MKKIMMVLKKISEEVFRVRRLSRKVVAICFLRLNALFFDGKQIRLIALIG